MTLGIYRSDSEKAPQLDQHVLPKCLLFSVASSILLMVPHHVPAFNSHDSYYSNFQNEFLLLVLPVYQHFFFLMSNPVLLLKTWIDGTRLPRRFHQIFCITYAIYPILLREAMTVWHLALGHPSNHVSCFRSILHNLAVFRAKFIFCNSLLMIPDIWLHCKGK
jgi:hypothetical protein